MRRSITSQSILLALCVSFCGAVTIVQSAPFPGNLPGTEIGGALPGTYEPSGAVWHTRLQQLFLVSDGGTVSRMNADGSGLQHWQTGGDLEGICVADPASNRVYVGVENPDSIREFDFVTGQVLRTFDLTATMQGAANSGLEGVTFVPDPQHPEGGLFYAGLQADGKIYVFNLPIASSTTSTTVTHVTTITPVAGRGDISGLNYDLDNEILYAVYDSSNKLRAMEADGTYIAEWDLPGNDQEGVAMRGCEIFIAEDVGPEFWSYGFPTDSDDEDGDGVLNCDDACPGTPSGTLVGLDGCEVTGGCINDGDCGDGAYCNGVETCQAGVCEDGTAVDCDDGVACTTDSCDEVGNTCTHVADDTACDDGSFCNGREICDAFGGCQFGAPPSCTGQLCSDALSQCVDCLVDGDCGSGEVCSSSSGQCVTPPPAAPLPIDVGEEWRHFKGTSEPPATWVERGFDDSTWLAGFSGFGYGSDCQVQHGTELADMQNGYVSVYIRQTFHVDDPAEVASLTLTLDYDDSFVAYLNGVEVARNNVVGTPPAHDQLATADHECSGSTGAANPPEAYSLGNGALVAGTNVIAIQGHNLTAGSSDFSLIPTLTSIESPLCLDDADCSDGLFCNGVEQCVAGACEAGTSIDCDDGVACTVDSCNEATDSCDNAPNDSACDDGLYCNGAETCGAAGCESGTPVECDDGIACTVDSCNEATDSCDSAPNDSACDDGLYCNGVETCGAVGCETGTPVACDDGVACTVDSCNEVSDSCDNAANDTVCDDGLYCNGAETCGAAGCEAGTPVECDDGIACTVDSCNESTDSCGNAPNDAVCNDGLYCNGAETCGAAGCESGTPVECDDGIACTADSCNESTDSCYNTPNDTVCNDGLYCNGTETCGAAGCEAGTAVECDDGVACTVDSCNEGADRCDNLANDAACDDGLYCNGAEICGAAGCEAGTPVECSDGIACTVDSCDEGSDSCDNAPSDAACDDGFFCNGAETCGPAGCETGTAVNCDDGVACTVDSCDELADSCSNAPNDAACNDGLFCNGTETCGAGGCDPGSAPACPGGRCSEPLDQCVECLQDADCAADELCNVSAGTCEPAPDCFVDGDCDDGLFCNGVEWCQGGQCRSGTAVNCDDGVACTTDACNESTDSCDNAPDDNACDDGFFCNGTETCGAAGCESGTPVDCDDGIACTIDSCDELADRCNSMSSNAICDDGMYCNGVETCGAAGCESGTPVDCDDGVACTLDTCNESTDGCSNAANDTACDDGLYCNGTESCGVAGCESGTPVDCSDGVACTVDACNESTDSCDNTPSDTVCDDGLYCNGAETCGAAGCENGSPVACDDGVACTIDSCNESTDSCDSAPNDSVCDDGLYCNGTETCGAAGCESGTAVDCDDGVACTVDSCNESTDNCYNTPNDMVCNDGLFCNGVETCGSAGCDPGTAPSCPGGQCSEPLDQCVECLQDADCAADELCNVSAGTCEPAPDCFVDGDCDDGLYCNGVESCQAGQCRSGSPVNCSDGIVCTVDACNESTDSCDNTPNDTVCDDGLYCNGAETCGAAGCDPGTAPACPGGQCSEPRDQCVECLQDADCGAGEQCNVATGTCENQQECYVDADCDDGDACSIDQCSAGSCVHSSPDGDNDGVSDCYDNCTSWANADQSDFDGDLIGDACERGPVLVDIDLSGRVDGLDLAALARAFGAICGESHYDPRADFDINCSIDGRDLATMAAQFGSAADIP